MTDYSKNVDYAAKDALATGDSAKKVLGSEIASEFDELVTAVASKYDSSDIASIAEAQALVSNTTLITPARLGSALAGAGAGALSDILALTDPGADRILFWDDSAGNVDWLSLAASLAITGTQLAVVPGSIDITALLNYSANKFVDHTTVSISGAGGITGGGTIAASRTLTLDITSLTVDASPDTAADYMITYDASAAANKKVLLSTLVGTTLGDGRWYRNTAQSIPAATATTIIYDTESYNNLTRGTYSVSTGLYTAGASGARLLVSASFTVGTLASSRSMTAIGTCSISGEVARASHTTIGGSETTPTVVISCTVVLAAAETFAVQGFVTTSANSTAAASLGKYNVLNIVEIG